MTEKLAKIRKNFKDKKGDFWPFALVISDRVIDGSFDPGYVDTLVFKRDTINAAVAAREKGLVGAAMDVISEWDTEMNGPLKNEAKPKLLACEINRLRKALEAHAHG